MMTKTSAIILCGGHSSRMGYPKAFLEKNGQSLLEHTVNQYIASGIKNIGVVLNKKLLFHPSNEVIKRIFDKCEIIPNSYPQKGRTYSISLGIRHCRDKGKCFLQNIDNPVPEVSVLKEMMQLIYSDDTFVVPQIKGKSGHPVLAGEKVVRHLAEKTDLDWNLKEELLKFKKITFPVEDKTLLMNLNSPEDWENFLKIKVAFDTI